MGEIAYLYNTYGQNTLSSVDAAALQVAIWTLEYNSTTDFTSSSDNFYILPWVSGSNTNYAISQSTYNDIVSQAQTYLTDATNANAAGPLGQSGQALFLAPTSTPTSGGQQGMIAPVGSFGFSDLPKNTPAINTSQTPATAYVGESISDTATVTGLLTPSSNDTVTFNLYSSATTQNSSTLLYSDTETVTLNGTTATATSKGYTAAGTGPAYWVATFNGDTYNNAVSSGATAETVNIDTINTSQTPANAYVGESISDTATVTGLVSPSSGDTVTFNLYNNANASGTPLFSDTETVSISGSTATATSKGYTTTGIGNVYWVATFNGDTNNAKVASGSAAETVNIDTINTAQQPASAVVGSTIADKATVTGLVSPSSSDTVTFNLYSNATASGTPLFTDTEKVSISGGTATATSAGYKSVATGTDYWVATFNGDSNNAIVSSGAADESVTLSPNTPAINTSQTPATAYVGEAIADTATVTGLVSPSSKDTVTFNLYNSASTQNSSTLLFTDTETVSINGTTATATSKGYTAAGIGTVYWVATFNGDTNNNSVTSGATAETVNVDTINTVQQPASASIGSSVADQATVTGLVSPSSSDTVTFVLYSSATTQNSSTQLFTDTEKVSISGSTATATSKGYTTSALGTDYWVATFNGDTNNAIVTSGATAEPVTINQATPSLTTTPNVTNVTLGSAAVTLKDTATLSGSYKGTGSITFTLYYNNGSSPIDTETVTVSGDGNYTTPNGYTLPKTGVKVTGTYQWDATYSGDTNNVTFSDNNSKNEQVTVGPPIVLANTLNTTPGGTVVLGSGTALSDSATVTGDYFPTGNIIFYLFAPGATNTTPLSSAIFTDTVAVNGNGTYNTSGGTTTGSAVPTQTGTYNWVAIYSGDANNKSLTSGFGAESEVVSSTSPTLTTTPSGATTPSSIMISGTKYLDATGNGFSSDDSGLSGVTIDLYADTLGTGVLDTSKDTLAATATTDSHGNYSFSNLAAGAYFVTEVVPSGYVQTGGGPNGSAGSTYYTVNAQNGYNYAGYNFDDFQIPTCKESGISFTVTTPSGCSQTYSSLAGNTQAGDTVTVTFTVPSGATDTMTLVSYEAPTSSWSDSQAYQQTIYQQDTGTFTAGTYSLTVKIPNTYYQIDFVCGQAINELEPNQNNNAYGPDSANILYHAEQRFIASDSGGCTAPNLPPASPPPIPTPTQTASTMATLNDSATLSGGYNAGGSITFYLFAPGVTPNGTNSNNVYSDTVTVNGNGTYTTAQGSNPGGYSAMAAGTYNWVAIYSGDSNNGSVTSSFGSEPWKVGLNTPSISTTPSGATAPSSIMISGTKYLDLTGNGFSSDDTAQSGVTIDVYLDTQGTGVLDTTNDTLVATATTDSHGNYSFNNLMAGTYFVTEVVPSGSIQTGGGPNGCAGSTYYTINAQNGYNYSGYNFDDFQIPTCTETCVSYTVTTPSGCSQTYSSLAGNTQAGDTVTVTFTVPSGQSDTMTLVSYNAPSCSWSDSTAYEQTIYQQDTGTFGPGTHSLTVQIPNNYYQIDFVCGQAINELEPNQNNNAYGPDSANILYHAEQRYISSDSGGNTAPNLPPASPPPMPTPTQTASTMATLNDSATLSAGYNLGGSITFYLFAPGATSSTPLSDAVYTDKVAVNGNGTYTTAQGNNAGGYVAMAAGTYQWVAVYSGDANNSSVTSSFGSEPWTVGLVSPSLTTTPGGSVVLDSCNDTLTDSATLSGGYNPTGTITFYLFAPGATASTPLSQAVYTDQLTVNGNGTYTTSMGTNAGGYVPAVTGTFEWVAIYSGDGNNNSVAGTFGDEAESVNAPSSPVSAGDFATIGFWRNQNGQAVINSFNGGSSATNLGNWLATNFPNLFGTSNPYISRALNQFGAASLAGLTNAQVATVYKELWTPSGVTKNTYVQAFAVALGMYADDPSLGYDSTAANYGFNSVTGGGSNLTYNVGSNGAAFGVANNTSLTVFNILSIVDSDFDASTGLFFSGSHWKTSELDNVLNGINTNGDI